MLRGKYATADIERIIIWKSKDYNEREHLLRKPTIAFDIRDQADVHVVQIPHSRCALCMCVCDMFQHTDSYQLSELRKTFRKPTSKVNLVCFRNGAIKKTFHFKAAMSHFLLFITKSVLLVLQVSYLSHK